LNPYKLNLTAGGSSGGEGALVALRGSIIGVGTDIGGSIRIPACCDGVLGFKPSAGRIPYGGQTAPGRKGSPGIQGAAGPLCTSLRDAEYFMKEVVGTDPWLVDATAISVPWRHVEVKKNLTFGLILQDKNYPLHPAILRNLRSAIARIEKSGHKIVSLDSLLPTALTVNYITEVAYRMDELDPKQTAYGHIAAGGEPKVPSINVCCLQHLSDYKPDLNDVWDLNAQRIESRAAFRTVFVENQLDGIIMPSYQATAVPHDSYGPAPYTVFANILDVCIDRRVSFSKSRLY
jgi:amidase